MHPNEQLITNFYKAFQTKDFITMQNAYAENGMFNDEVFRNLNAGEVRSMWEMLIKTGKDLQLEFSNVNADDKKGSAEWIATYTFTKTKRKVINRIKANFDFENGKIVKHTDKFDFYAWAKQAFGITGVLLGWTGVLKNKVRAFAKNNLDAFMQGKK